MNIYTVDFENIIGFDWDKGNIGKSYPKHGIKNNEAEEVFFGFNLVLVDEEHSIKEKRFWLLGETDAGKVLFIVFTLRDNKIRIISARIASKKERNKYYQEKKNYEKNSTI